MARDNSSGPRSTPGGRKTPKDRETPATEMPAYQADTASSEQKKKKRKSLSAPAASKPDREEQPEADQAQELLETQEMSPSEPVDISPVESNGRDVTVKAENGPDDMTGLLATVTIALCVGEDEDRRQIYKPFDPPDVPEGKSSTRHFAHQPNLPHPHYTIDEGEPWGMLMKIRSADVSEGTLYFVRPIAIGPPQTDRFPGSAKAFAELISRTTFGKEATLDNLIYFNPMIAVVQFKKRLPGRFNGVDFLITPDATDVLFSWPISDGLIDELGRDDILYRIDLTTSDPNESVVAALDWWKNEARTRWRKKLRTRTMGISGNGTALHEMTTKASPDDRAELIPILKDGQVIARSVLLLIPREETDLYRPFITAFPPTDGRAPFFLQRCPLTPEAPRETQAPPIMVGLIATPLTQLSCCFKLLPVGDDRWHKMADCPVYGQINEHRMRRRVPPFVCTAKGWAAPASRLVPQAEAESVSEAEMVDSEMDEDKGPKENMAPPAKPRKRKRVEAEPVDGEDQADSKAPSKKRARADTAKSGKVSTPQTNAASKTMALATKAKAVPLKAPVVKIAEGSKAKKGLSDIVMVPMTKAEAAKRKRKL